MLDQTGVLRGKTRRAVDSVVLDAAAATQDTVTQLIAAVRRRAARYPAPPTWSRSPQLIRSAAAGSTAGESRITNKVTKTTPRERFSPQNGMPEPVPYVYRQQNRRNDWAARIARPNAEVWWPTAVSAP